MPSDFFEGLYFGTSCARISIIYPRKELRYSNLVNYKYCLKNSQWRAIKEMIINIPIVSSKKLLHLGLLY